MKDSAKLKQERSEKRAKLQEIHNAAKEEKRDYTEAEQGQVDTLLEEIRGLDSSIERAEATEKELQRNAAAAAGAGSAQEISKKEERELKNYSFLSVVRAAANNSPLEGLEREMQEEAKKEMRDASITPQNGSLQIPSLVLRKAWNMEQRDITATGGTDGDQGGVNIQTNVSGYIETLKTKSILMGLGADMMDGLVGNLDIPREASDFVPTWKAENGTADELTLTWDKVEFRPNRLAGTMDVSDQMMVQTAGSIERRLRNQIVTGHAIALDKAGWQGSGASNQPFGIINDADVDVIAIGANGGSITDDLILQMEEAIDIANALDGSLAYAVTPALRKILKQLKLDTGSGLFAWDRITNMLNSYKAISTNQLPTDLTKGTSTNECHAIVFGDYSGCAFASWGGLEIKVDPFTKAADGLTRMILNSYNDFGVLQPGKFSVIKDITVS